MLRRLFNADSGPRRKSSLDRATRYGYIEGSQAGGLLAILCCSVAACGPGSKAIEDKSRQAQVRQILYVEGDSRAEPRRYAPLLLYGVLLFCFGISMHLFGVAMVIP